MKRSGLFPLPFERIVLALAILAWVFAPLPALAQHGGGHGGGAHFGGGGGHFSSGGGNAAGNSHPAANVSQPPKPRAFNGPSSATVNAGRHPAYGPLPLSWGAGLNRPTVPGVGKGIAAFNPAPTHTTIGFPPVPGGERTFPDVALHSGPLSFSGQGHEIWQDSPEATPPAARAQLSPIVMRPLPPHIINPIAPFPGAYPFYGYYGFTPFLGFGWGLGCDPFDPNWAFDCGPGYGYGFGPGYGYGYGYGGYYPPAGDYSAPPPEEPPSDGESYDINAHNSWQEPPSDSNSPSAAPAPNTVLYLQDGSNYEISDYWLAEGKLHYVTNYGGENSVDLDRVDIQRTVDANASRGLTFSLHPAENKALTPPPSTDNAPHEPAAPPSPAAPQP